MSTPTGLRGPDGAELFPVDVAAASFAVDEPNQVLRCDTSAAASAVLLPHAPFAGWFVCVADDAGHADAHPITVSAAGGTLIDGAASFVLSRAGGFEGFVFDGAQFRRVTVPRALWNPIRGVYETILGLANEQPGASAAVAGLTGVAVPDIANADVVLTAAEQACAIIAPAGSLAGLVSLVFAPPATAAAAFVRVVRNDCGPGEGTRGLVVTTGEGATFTVSPGDSVLLSFEPTTGVHRVVTGV